MVGHAEDLHRLVELVAAVLAEPALLLVREVAQVGDEHLAHLAGRAGHEGDADALVDVAGHRGAVADALVVGVGVDEQHVLGGRVMTLSLGLGA